MFFFFLFCLFLSFFQDSYFSLAHTRTQNVFFSFSSRFETSSCSMHMFFFFFFCLFSFFVSRLCLTFRSHAHAHRTSFFSFFFTVVLQIGPAPKSLARVPARCLASSPLPIRTRPPVVVALRGVSPPKKNYICCLYFLLIMCHSGAIGATPKMCWMWMFQIWDDMRFGIFDICLSAIN